MSDNNDNIIDFSKRSSNIGKETKEKLLNSFPYIKLTKDTNGNYFNEKSLIEYSKKVNYIVTIMRKSTPSVALYKYKIPQSYLTDFLNLFKNNSDGEIVEIEKYIPEDLA